MMQALQSQTDLPPNTASQTLERSVEEFQDAVSRHLPMLHKRAYRYLGNAHDAEDAVQDALLSAYKHLDQFKGNARMTTWLTSIVRNSALTYLRRRPRQTHTSLDEPLTHDTSICLSDKLIDVRPNPENECAMSEVHGHLLQIAGRLSLKSHRAIQLCGFNEMTVSEAACIVGVPAKTIKTRLSRARSQMKRKVKLDRNRTTVTAEMYQFITLPLQQIRRLHT
jgi:RNA polymerase sigma-70 factor, ECF subfamily